MRRFLWVLGIIFVLVVLIKFTSPIHAQDENSTPGDTPAASDSTSPDTSTPAPQDTSATAPSTSGIGYEIIPLKVSADSDGKPIETPITHIDSNGNLPADQINDLNIKDIVIIIYGLPQSNAGYQLLKQNATNPLTSITAFESSVGDLFSSIGSWINCNHPGAPACPVDDTSHIQNNNIHPSINDPLNPGQTLSNAVYVLVCADNPNSVKFNSSCTGNNQTDPNSTEPNAPSGNTYFDAFFGGATHSLGNLSDNTQYFRAGNKYSPLLLRQGDNTSEVLDMSFYVNHSFPNVYLNMNKGPVLVAQSPQQLPIPDTDLKQEITNYNNCGVFATGDPGSDCSNANTIAQNQPPIYEGNDTPQTIQVSLAGLKPGGIANNRYHIVMQSDDGQYNNKTYPCVDVSVDSWDAPATSPQNPQEKNQTIQCHDPVDLPASLLGNGVKTFPTGNYTIQVKDANGFVFWNIHVSVSQSSNGTYTVTESTPPEQDPNGQDIESQKQSGVLSKSPCAPGTWTATENYIQNGSEQVSGPNGGYDEKTGLCHNFVTALGTFSTDPVIFFSQIFLLFLRIAGIAAFLMLLYAGYQLLISQGDKQKVADARARITSTIVGLLFIIFSLVILQFIAAGILKIPGFS